MKGGKIILLRNKVANLPADKGRDGKAFYLTPCPLHFVKRESLED
jgi:hypothetical protein